MNKMSVSRSLLAGVLSFLAGIAVMLFIYPFIFPPPVLNEKISQYSRPKQKLHLACLFTPIPRILFIMVKGQSACISQTMDMRFC